MTFNFTVKEFILGNGTGTPTFQFYRKGFELGASGGSPGPEWKDIILKGNTALTLVNAKANGLNYLKLFGGTEQRNLPSGYTQVDGVTNYDGGYVNTGINADVDDMEFDIVAKINNSVSTSWYILQSRIDASAPIYGISGSASGNTFIGAFSGTNVSIGATVFRQSNHTYHVNLKCQNGTITLTVEDLTDNTSTTNTGTYTFVAGTTNIGLFSNLNGGNLTNGNTSVLSAYIKKSGVKVMDYVSCTDSSNIAGFYDKVTNSLKSATGGGFIAGDTTVPSPNTPMDIVSNNGVLKYGKPITLDSTRYYAYITTNSTWAYSNDSYSIIVPVEVGQKYKITADPTTLIGGAANVILRWGFANTINEDWKNDNLTGQSSIVLYDWVRTTPQDTQTVEITATHPYLVIQMGAGIFADNITNGRILLTEQSIYTDGTTETVEVTGKNLYDITDDTYGYAIDANGNIFSTTNSCYSSAIPVTIGEYTYSGVCSNQGSSNNKRIHGYLNGIWVQQIALTTIPAGTAFNYTFTVPSGINEIRISHWSEDTNTQLELGSTATTYEPYYNGGQATAEMLLKVGNYQDIQSVLDGVVNRQLGVLVLDGVTNGRKFASFVTASGYNRASVTITDKNNNANDPLVCTHFVNANSAQVNTCSSASNRSVTFRFAFNTLEEANDFLADQYNSGNPVVVVYPLATATTETVESQALTIQAGTNIVQITQASMDNLELEVSYKAGVAVTITEIENAQLDNSVEVTING